MPKYLWKAKGPSGEPVVQRVEAASLQEAKQALLDAGFTELEAQSDDIVAASVAMFDPADQPYLTPEEELQYQNVGSFRTRDVVWGSVWGNKGWILFWGAIAAGGFYFQSWWMIGLGLLAMVALPIYGIMVGMPGLYYTRLNKAKVWARWQEVLDCVQALRNMKWSPIRLPAAELARCEGQALAATGKLSEGLAKYSPYANSMPKWLYYSQCVSIYDEGRDFDRALEYTRKAVELEPANSTLLLDLAVRLVLRHSNPVEAQAVLEQVDQSVLPPIAKPYVAFCKGLIARRRGVHAEARAKFAEAVDGFSKMLHHDLVEGTYLLAKAHLCATERALGNHGVADQLWKDTEKFLRAQKEEELIRACAK